MSRTVRKIVVTQNSRRIFGSAFTLLGLIFIIGVLLNAWVMGIPLLDLSALNQFLLTNRFNIGFGISFDFIYIIVAGAVMVLLGVSILALKTERVEEMTVITDDVTVTLECINCGYHWDENFTKTQLQSMGFPQNRKISRRRCLFCGRFTRPNIISI